MTHDGVTPQSVTPPLRQDNALLRQEQDADRLEFDGNLIDATGRPADVGYRDGGAEAEDSANYFAEAVIWCFNPPDDDGSQDELLVDAIFRARDFIEAQPCLCERVDCGGPKPEVDGPCDRCSVLGRIENEVQSR